MSISVAIADDHSIVRAGIVALLGVHDIQVVAELSSGREAFDYVRQNKPDILLLDVRMDTDRGGLETLEAICVDPIPTKVVMLSSYDNPTYIARAIALGADDYLLKTCSQEQLIKTLHRVHQQRPTESSSIFGQISAKMAKCKTVGENQALPLTLRESQVLRHIAFGLSNREIGRSLKISVETVKEHVQNILRKIDATDRTQAAVLAVRNKLV